jgi:DNA replication protein DnaC
MTPVTVTDRTALAGALRDLKLSGMLDTLDARLAQAHAGDLGHLDFLQVLCQDEISRRASMSLQRRIRRARFETEATLEGFDFAASPKLPAAQIRDLAALRWLAGGESVILYGPVGVGKSHVAQALAHLAVRSGASARFMTTTRALAHLAGGRADRTWDKRLAELTRPVVLILDDFAMRELTAVQADDLYELITERSGRSLILTSNRGPSDWYPLFPNPVVAESLLDRLINTSHQVFMNGPSYRPNKAPGRVIPPAKTSGN